MKTNKIRNRFFHGCSNGKRTGVIFHGKRDYVLGMNRVAYCAGKFHGQVQIVGVCLMQTHVHFLLYGEAQTCAQFLETFDHMTIRQLRKDGYRDMEELYFELREVTPGDGLKSELAYIMRNPTQAGLPYFPWEYPWGSGASLDNSENMYLRALGEELGWSEHVSNIQKIKVGDLSATSKNKLFHSTNCQVPDEWTIIELIYNGSEGEPLNGETVRIVLPNNYIEKNFVGFYSKKELLFYLGKIRDDKVIDESIEGNSNGTLSVSDLKAMLTRIFLEHYANTKYRRVRDLPIEDRQKLACELFKMTNSSIWFIAQAAQIRFDEAVAAIWD